MAIEAILFDVGGVLLRTTDRSGRQKWERWLNLAPGGLERLVFDSPQGVAAQLGNLSDQELWQWLGDRFALSSGERQQLNADFWRGDTWDDELIEMVGRLRQTCRTGIVSNATLAMRQRMLAERPVLADLFEVIVVSADEGVMKPAAAIFEVALSSLGVEASRCIFVDDFQHNVAAARALGMRAVHFSSRQELTAALSQMGLAPA